jgi:hypothetical protein
MICLLIYGGVDAMTPLSGDLHAAVSNVAYFIQLSVAPVFLLTGVGAMLGVLTNRLSRIIDRARILEAQHAVETEIERRANQHAMLRVLSRRARLVSWAISLCTTCSLFVSMIIVILCPGGAVVDALEGSGSRFFHYCHVGFYRWTIDVLA